jgi:hypothetical protein
VELLDEALDAFLVLLRTSWHPVKASLVGSAGWDESVVSDWMQANWELIVEAALSRESQISLEVYGDGADCNDGTSRVWRPSSLPTHAVACLPRDTTAKDQLTGQDVPFPAAGLPLSEFVTMVDGSGWFRAMPPFDCALLDVDGREVVVALPDLAFTLRPA